MERDPSEVRLDVRLTPEEAVRYREAAQVLNAQLREILPRLEADNPRKKEWGTP
jgi:hypothetical protein